MTNLFDQEEITFCAPPPTTAPSLPVFNPLAYDGARCEGCQQKRQAFYLSCYSRSGAHLPNRFVCPDCLPEAEKQAKSEGLFERFTLRLEAAV